MHTEAALVNWLDERSKLDNQFPVLFLLVIDCACLNSMANQIVKTEEIRYLQIMIYIVCYAPIANYAGNVFISTFRRC